MMKKSTIAYSLMLLIAILAVTMWYLRPERALAWVAAMLILPIGGTLIILARRGGRCSDSKKGVQAIYFGIIAGGLILIAALAGTMIEYFSLFDVEPGEISGRTGGVVVGIVMAIYANFMPKSVASPKTQALLRFGGWVLLIAGLGYALAWVVTPIESANLVTMLIMLTGVVLVVSRIVWAYITKRKPRPPAET